MILFVHTKTHIFTIANGYCSAVRDADGEHLASEPLVGGKLAGIVCDNDYEATLALEEYGKRPGAVYRLKFDLGGISLISEPMLCVEEALVSSPNPLSSRQRKKEVTLSERAPPRKGQRSH